MNEAPAIEKTVTLEQMKQEIAEQNALMNPAQVFRSGPPRFAGGTLFEQQPTNPALLTACKQIYKTQSCNFSQPIQEFTGADLNADEPPLFTANGLMVEKINTCMDQLMSQANSIGKPWVSELYVLLLRAGVLFEQDDLSLSLMQRKSINAVLKTIFEDVEKNRADIVTTVERELLKAVVENLETQQKK